MLHTFLTFVFGPIHAILTLRHEVTPKLKLNLSLLSAIPLHNCLTHTSAHTPMISMNSNDFTENESVLGSGEIRSTPTTQCKLCAMHNCNAQSYSTVSYWDRLLSHSSKFLVRRYHAPNLWTKTFTLLRRRTTVGKCKPNAITKLISISVMDGKSS